MDPSFGGTGYVTATQRLVSVAAAFGGRPALTGRQVGQLYSYGELATTIQQAAAGLAHRGLRPRDVVAVYAPDAACYMLACHAVCAAGGVPCLVTAGLSIEETAGHLARCGARILLTGQPLAATALAAADRSWVREVISFDEAPAATSFTALLGTDRLPPGDACGCDLALLTCRRRHDGGLDLTEVTHLAMAAELGRLACTPCFSDSDVVLAAPPAGDGSAYTAYLNHALLQGATVIAAISTELAAATSTHAVTAAILPQGVRVPGCESVRLFAVAT
jgi:hypothetical protein